jgi:hypothetical protein
MDNLFPSPGKPGLNFNEVKVIPVEDKKVSRPNRFVYPSLLSSPDSLDNLEG